MVGPMKKHQIFTLLASASICTAFLLNGCSSSYNVTHSVSEDGATYGSGANHTKPYPQKDKVNLNNVPGVTPMYEPMSRGGNKNYTVLGQNYEVWLGCKSYLEYGTASWYGPGFHGNKTSNGEVYNQKGFSAAHKNLPLPSYLKVTNLDNGRAVVVRVNDRGPFHGTRIIDLSEGAARQLDMIRTGTAKVKIEYIDIGPNNLIANATNSKLPGTTSPSTSETIKNVASGNINADTVIKVTSTIKNKVATASNNNTVSTGPTKTFVQVFTSSSKQRASEIAKHLNDEISYDATVQKLGNSLYRVMVGPLPDNASIKTLAEIKNLGYSASFIKRI